MAKPCKACMSVRYRKFKGYSTKLSHCVYLGRRKSTRKTTLRDKRS